MKDFNEVSFIGRLKSLPSFLFSDFCISLFLAAILWLITSGLTYTYLFWVVFVIILILFYGIGLISLMVRYVIRYKENKSLGGKSKKIILENLPEESRFYIADCVGSRKIYTKIPEWLYGDDRAGSTENILVKRAKSGGEEIWLSPKTVVIPINS